MKFGLTGDTHNNLKNIAVICELFNKFKLDFVIHTGDITLPKSLILFEKLMMPLNVVFGNNDQGDKEELIRVCKQKKFSYQDELQIDLQNDKKIIALHDPKDIKEEFYKDGNIIVHGHTHRFRDEKINGSHIFNPGECAGFIKGQNKIGIIETLSPQMKVISF